MLFFGRKLDSDRIKFVLVFYVLKVYSILGVVYELPNVQSDEVGVRMRIGIVRV